MAFQTVWHFSDIPDEMIDIIERDSEKYSLSMEPSKVYGNEVSQDVRKSSQTWIPTSNWIGGFLWHYIEKANRENFLYDLRNIDGEAIQYTTYNPGDFYNWHNDSGISIHYKPTSEGCSTQDSRMQDFLLQGGELVRKLSFVVQLSNYDEYEGGNLQLMGENGKSYFAPRKKGTIILFDSRTMHRVCKVKSGVRKSLVGWVVGPRWR